MDDKDVLTLRRFRSALDEPSPDALARARCRALDGREASPARSRRRWTLVGVPVTAAAVVGATVLVVTSALPPATPTGGQTSAPLMPGAPASATTPSPTPPSARHVIEQLALLAEKAPAPRQPRPDQLILRLQTEYDSGGAHKSQAWLDPNGAIELRTEAGGYVEEVDPTTLAYLRAERDRIGPRLILPTWTEMSTHTTDPAELLRELTEGQTPRPHAETVVQIIAALSPRLEALAPPRLKAGLLRALNLLDGGVTADLVTAPDGSQVWAIGAAHDLDMRVEIMVSATTGMVVGERNVRFVDYVGTPRAERTRMPIAPKVSRTVMWQVSLVAA